MQKLIISIISVVIIIVIALATVPAYSPIDYQYKYEVVVDKAEKIPQAISNGVEDVSSRNFLVLSQSVKYCFVDKTFKVTVTGITKGKLLTF